MSNHSTSEVGHAKNVSNFEDLVAFCVNFGATYNPVNPLLTVAGLQSKLSDAQSAIENVHETKASFTMATNGRQVAFEPLSPLATKIVNALAAITNDQRIIADARTFVRKIRGDASKPRTDDSEPGQETERPRSNSQQSYDKLIDHFSGLLELLGQVPAYAPNETELTLAELQSYLTELKSQNTAVMNAYTPYSTAMLTRNGVLYDPMNGLVAVAKLCKQYVRSVFGSKSAQYGQVSGIEFRTLKA